MTLVALAMTLGALVGLTVQAKEEASTLPQTLLDKRMTNGERVPGPLSSLQTKN